MLEESELTEKVPVSLRVGGDGESMLAWNCDIITIQWPEPGTTTILSSHSLYNAILSYTPYKQMKSESTVIKLSRLVR